MSKNCQICGKPAKETDSKCFPLEYDYLVCHFNCHIGNKEKQNYGTNKKNSFGGEKH